MLMGPRMEKVLVWLSFLAGLIMGVRHIVTIDVFYNKNNKLCEYLM